MLAFATAEHLNIFVCVIGRSCTQLFPPERWLYASNWINSSTFSIMRRLPFFPLQLRLLSTTNFDTRWNVNYTQQNVDVESNDRELRWCALHQVAMRKLDFPSPIDDFTHSTFAWNLWKNIFEFKVEMKFTAAECENVEWRQKLISPPRELCILSFELMLCCWMELNEMKFNFLLQMEKLEYFETLNSLIVYNKRLNFSFQWDDENYNEIVVLSFIIYSRNIYKKFHWETTKRVSSTSLPSNNH